MNDTTLNRINRFLSKELYHNLSDISIFKLEDGSYEIFNKYHIVEQGNRYQVSVNSDFEVKYFYSLQNAITWCNFDNRNKFNQAKRIEYLDTMISGADANISIHQHLINKTKDTEYKLIYLAKMNEEQAKRKFMIREMSGFVNEFRAWQTKKFATK